MKPKKALKILSSLSQETRLAIFRLLIQEGSEGLSAGMISEILQVPSATLSFHLSQLADAGVLKSHKQGRTIMYSAKQKSIKKLMAYLLENSYKSRLKDEKGVTLVELAISIALIGMLIAGTLGGMNMLKASKLRRVATEFTNLKQSAEEFEVEYGYLPGDMPTASNFWTNANNGDGDSYIDGLGNGTDLEDLYVWQHLGMSGLILGTYTGAVVSGSQRFGLDVNAPASKAYNNLVYSFEMWGGFFSFYGTYGNTFRLSSLDSAGNAYGNAFMARDAYSIDMKLDDGLASKGNLYSWRGVGDAGCTDNPFTQPSADYDLDSTEKTCRLLYWYKKM